MKPAYICDAIRTPVGRYGGSLATLRTDDLAAIPLAALKVRNAAVDWEDLDDVLLGCANQAGEDNRNVARMALLLAGIPETVSGSTVNRLCGSGLDAVGSAARLVMTGEADLVIAGGVESMSRAPFVIAKAETAFARSNQMFDTTLGWRFINDRLDAQYGTDSMSETAENIAREYQIHREDQDRFALWSQVKAATAQTNGLFARETTPVLVPQRKADPLAVERDEHPRSTTLEKLASLRPILGEAGTVTAGNASGINDGAAALLVASEEALTRHGLTPLARVLGTATAGVAPRLMGLGPVPATKKLLNRLGLSLDDMDLIELNEAFAVQALGCTREFGLADDDPRINPQGGAIAIGHPLGMSGARLATTAVHQLAGQGGRLGLCSMCIGVGQGIAMVIEAC
jgi:3-oxoadipyl-CoA thiolase